MRPPSPRVLLAASLLLFVVFVAGVLVTRRPAPRPAPPPRPLPPITAVRVRPGAYGAVVRWRTPLPSTALVRWGPAGAAPLLWRAAGASATRHVVRLTGLVPRTSYVVSVASWSADGRRASITLQLRSGSVPPTATGAVRDGVVRIDGAPFFPLIAWQECPDRWLPDLHDGIDLFGGDPCTGLASLLTGVAGRAVVAGTADDAPEATGPGLVGWFLPDEADARGLTGATLPPAGPGLRFLTLTSHFYAGAAPLPGGRGMYPGLVSHADVVGFDLYPLQELCRPDLLPSVYDAQRALRLLAPGKATFQWIEERELRCPQPDAAVTPATIRVESWLAIAGGAAGLGFFPSDWSPDVGRVIRGVATQVQRLAPALLQPPLAIGLSPAAPEVRASARSFGGALYVIAVNAGTAGARVQLSSQRLRGRSFTTLQTGRPLHAAAGVLDVALPPRSVRIYVAPPAG